jgi:DNA invertase Pin-like site-specific DNA recombinase
MDGRAALYARISTTKQHGQDPLMQLLPLRDFARARSYVIVEEYVDVGGSRPELDRLMREIR